MPTTRYLKLGLAYVAVLAVVFSTNAVSHYAQLAVEVRPPPEKMSEI